MTKSLVVVGLCLLSVTKSNAQEPEAESLQFVPASTYAAMSLNMRGIFKKVDLDGPLISRLRQLRHLNSWFLDDPKSERTVLLFSSQVDKNSRPASPRATLMRFEVPATPKAFFDRMQLLSNSEFTHKDYNGHRIYSRVQTNGVQKGRVSKTVWFFPDKNVVGSGGRDLVEQMIDGETSNSDGKTLAEKLDTAAEFHFVLECKEEIDTRVLASVFGHFDPLPARLIAEALQDAKRAEVLFNYAEEVPVQITIEMKDGASTDRLMEQIKGVLAEALGILDALEEHEIPREKEVQLPFLELIAIGRTADKEMKLERAGTAIRMTLGHVKGLEKLPQAYLSMSMIQAAMSGP